MVIYIYELEDLKDIMNTIVFEDEPSIFTEDYASEFVETVLYLMDDFMNDNPSIITEPEFNEILFEEIQEIFYTQFEEHIKNYNIIEDDIEELLEVAFNIYVTSFYPERSIFDSCVETPQLTEESLNIIEDKIQKLREIPQPVQRTPEWYQFRWNLITASNAYKAFGTQSTINQLIYEKCQPLKTMNDVEVKMVNTNTPLHWGQKYEPLTVLIYEHEYKTKVEDFGCIQHPIYKFIGASPDGIIVGNDSDRYGRMLEIKNVVSRDITGIPKKEYWIQMQLQMEVCDLDECDFLETKFIEYPDSTSYNEDLIENTININIDNQNNCLTKDGKQKGIIIYFHTKEGTPFYIYKPISLIHSCKIQEWEDKTVSLYQSDKYNYTFLKFIYWKVEVFSCVLVLRNKEWFKNSISQIEDVWKIIEEERITGYTHRAPNKKVKKEATKPFINIEPSGCLLLNKIIKINDVN